MNKRLLWALLSWLSLLSFGARAQTTLATETFEAAGTDFGYTANNFNLSTIEYFERRAFAANANGTGYPGTTQGLNNRQGAYTWTAEGVRGVGTTFDRPAGYVILNPITNSASYKNFVVTVAFAAPRGGTFTGAGSNGVRSGDRIRIQYSFNGGTWTTAALIMGNNRTNVDASDFEQISPMSDSTIIAGGGTPSNQGTILDQTYRDITASLPASAIGANLRVRVVASTLNPEFAFDNIRVTGVLDNTAKPTLNNLESTTLNYTEGGSPVQLTSTLTVGYSDNSATNITGGTVTIGNFAAQDQLIFINQTPITGSYNTGTGVLTLSGTASQAAYQAALRSITYSSSNTTTLPSGSRTISFQVSSGSVASGAVSRQLAVTGVLNAPAALNYTEDFTNDGEGTRYFGNTFFSQSEQTGFFRATTNPPTYNGNTVSTRTYSGFSGGFWYGEGTDGANNPNAPYATLQLAPVNATNRAGLKFTIAVGASPNWSGYTSAANPGDSFELYFRANGGSLVKFASFYGPSGTNSNPRLDTDNDITTPPTGTALTTTLQDFTFTLPAAAAVGTLDFFLRQRTGGDTELAFDNIRITAAVAPTVTTTTPSGVTGSSATLGGNITSDGGGTLSERGVVYVAGTGTPTTSNTKALVSTSGVTTGAYSGQVSGLAPGTTYTVRAYAINDAGTSYGATSTFTTASTTPTVTTAAPANVSAASATLGGNVTADGGATVTGRGVVYSLTGTNGTPTIGGTGVTNAVNGTGTGTFSATISNLTPGTSYSVQAYATNSNGTVYGGVQTFTTLTTTPTVATVAPTNITASSAVLGGNVTADGGATVSGRGVVYSVTSTNGTPTVGGTGVAQAANGSGTGTFSATISSLAPGTSYSVQAYATNSNGTVYGGVQTFTTAANPATVTTAAATSITQTSAVLGGNVTADGGGTVTTRGVVYSVSSTNGTPTIGGTGVTNAANGTGTGSFSATISGLTAGTSYAVQAYATNSAGTSYGGVQTFTTAAATVTVTSVTRLTLSPTATAQVSYRVVFSGSVSGVTTSNFTTTNSGTTVTGSSVSSASGSGTTYTVVVNTGTGDGTLRLDVANSTGISPTVTNVPYTAGEAYTITKSFAAAPTLRIQGAGSASGNSDVTAFVDVVQVLQSGTSTAVANALQNTSFESNNVSSGSYLYQSQGVVATPWTFGVQAGVSRNNSAFGSTAADGDAVTFLQSTASNNGNVTQNLAVPTGSYQVRFRAIQRNYTSLDQRLNVFVNDVFVGNIQPNNIPTYDTFTSAAFSVTAPALTATVSTTSPSPTSTTPIPFSVSFSQSVGFTFTASDVTVAGGTVTSGSLSGSGSGPYSFTVTPSAAGSTVTVSLAAGVAQDANNTNNSASSPVSVQYVPTLVISPGSLPNGTVGVAYSQTFTASNGTAPYSYAITAGALPAGMTLASNGSFSGTPTAGGSFTFTVTATDASAAPGPYSGSQAYTLSINAPTITVVPASLPNATVGVAYSQNLAASGGTAPYSFSITDGALPAGLTLSSAGVISGTPTGGTSTFTVTATDASTGSGPYRGTRSYTLTIGAPTITVAPVTLPDGTVGAAYSQTLTASGGAAPYSYAITAGALPAGMSLAANGSLAGTPTAGGSFTFTVTATDASTGSGPYSGSRSYTLTVGAPSITVAPGSLPNGTQGVAYSQTFTGSGGTAPYRFAITAGALPRGLTLTSGGTLSGTPTTNGSFNFTVTVTDASTGSGPYSGSQLYTLTIAAPAVTSVVWTGTNSTDWFTASNWSPTQVPDATIDAIIPTAPSGNRFPFLTSGTANARNLSLGSGATLTQTDGTLALAANLVNNGTFQPRGGTVVLGNTTLSNILGSSNTRFWNLTVGASGAQSSTSASTSVQRVLTLNGNFATQSNPFTLESSASGTAMVVNNGSAVVTGSLTVQRYIDPSTNAGLGYRHFASPISSATVASLATASFSPVVNPDYNTSATPAKVRPFPTVYGYDQARLATASNNLSAFDKGWVSPDNTAAPLTVGQGYTVNLAANQTFALTGAPNNAATQPISLTLSRNAVGTPNAGDAGFQLVGNPFPSPLDFSLIAATDRANLDPAAYVYTSNGQFTGSYRTILNGVGGSSILPLGQGFFVHVANDATSAILNFRNSQRVTSYSNVAYQRTGETRPLVQLSLQGTGSPLADAAYVYFENGATDGYESAFDALKLPNPTGLNLSASLADKQLAIDGHSPLGTSQRVVPLAVGVPAPGSYSLTATQLLNLATTPVYLRDVQTGAVVDLQQQPTYQFTVSNAAALVTGRFELVFSPQQPLATAPAALAQQVALYPNPAKTTAFLELPASLGRQAVTATLVDALGRVVRTVSLPAQGAVAHPLDLHELATGVYALRLTTSAGTIVKRLTVE